MSKSLRRKAGILATALAATAVVGAALAPAASAAVPNVPYASAFALSQGGFIDNDHDEVISNGLLNSVNINGHYARYKLHSADTWEKRVDVTDPSGKVVGTLITRDGTHDTGYVTVPESLYNKGYTLVFSKQKTFSVDRKFQVALNNGGSSGSHAQHPVGFDIELNWRQW